MSERIDYTDLLGKEFAYGGRGPDEYDCYGLAIEVRRRVGLFTPPDYLSCEEPGLIQERLWSAKHLFRQLEAPRPYCVASFWFRPGITSHIGVVLEDFMRFIHVSFSAGVAVERLSDPAWRRRVTGFWEHAGGE